MICCSADNWCHDSRWYSKIFWWKTQTVSHIINCFFVEPAFPQWDLVVSVLRWAGLYEQRLALGWYRVCPSSFSADALQRLGASLQCFVLCGAATWLCREERALGDARPLFNKTYLLPPLPFSSQKISERNPGTPETAGSWTDVQVLGGSQWYNIAGSWCSTFRACREQANKAKGVNLLQRDALRAL